MSSPNDQPQHPPTQPLPETIEVAPADKTSAPRETHEAAAKQGAISNDALTSKSQGTHASSAASDGSGKAASAPDTSAVVGAILAATGSTSAQDFPAPPASTTQAVKGSTLGRSSGVKSDAALNFSGTTTSPNNTVAGSAGGGPATSQSARATLYSSPLSQPMGLDTDGGGSTQSIITPLSAEGVSQGAQQPSPRPTSTLSRTRAATGPPAPSPLLLAAARNRAAALTTSGMSPATPTAQAAKSPSSNSSAALADGSYQLPRAETASTSTLKRMLPSGLNRKRSTSGSSIMSAMRKRTASAASSLQQPGSPNSQSQSYLSMAKQQTEKAEEAESKGGRKGRRMSLGAALMMPPPPRVNDNMDIKTLVQFTVSALGILYGDVATGPMYIFKSAMRDSTPATLQLDVLGCLSFITWTTILLGIVKYCLIILHADNNGEGGQLALLSLIPQPDDDACPPWLARNYKKVFYLALIGTAFLLSDGLVGPALAMLAALEGFRVAEVEYPAAFAGFPVESWRVPVTCALLAPLFYVQRYGLGRITAVFPVLMAVWFGSMAIVGAYNIYVNPSVLAALNPGQMFVFMAQRGFGATMNMLSNVMLVASGLEFLYADLGVFRRKPILLSFTLVCVPATLLNYFGQAAFLLDANPTSTPALHKLTANLFFDSFPSWSIWPLVLVGCIVSAVGSQSAISGCFALLDQAISLRAVPTIESIHVVGYGGHGTFYVPVFCFILFVGGLLLAGITQDSEILSSTVGVCVAGAMLISSILLLIVMHVKWSFPRWKLAAYSIVLALDIMLFLSSMAKLAELAWVTLIFSAVIVYIMFVYVHTWEDINKTLDDRLWTLTQVRQHIRQHSRVKGLGVFVACTDEEVPHVLTVLASRLPALPEDIVLLTVQCMKGLPFVAEADRVIVRAVDPSMGVYRILISYGFAERSADVVQALAKAKKRGLKVKNEDNVTYYVSRYSVRTKREHPFYRRWQYKLYEALSRNTNNQVDALGLPVDKVVEVSNVLIL